MVFGGQDDILSPTARKDFGPLVRVPQLGCETMGVILVCKVLDFTVLHKFVEVCFVVMLPDVPKPKVQLI